MNIVSFGGGTNSAALLIGLYKHKIPIDLITFADTGAEHPHTYQFIEIINQWLAEHGMPQITVVQYVDRYGNRLYSLRSAARSGSFFICISFNALAAASNRIISLSCPRRYFSLSGDFRYSS